MSRSDARAEGAWQSWLGCAGLLLLCLCGGMARAADGAAVRTARLAYVQGSVSILRVDNTGADPAQLNMPLTEGSRVSTGDDGQAEIEFEDGSVLRITPLSSVLLTQLGYGANGGLQTELGLLNGLVYAELRAASQYTYRVNAGGEIVTPVTNATVRIELDQPPAAIAVLDGTAHVERAGVKGDNGYQVDVAAGESLRSDAGGGSRYFLSPSIEHNSWDDWNEEREQAAANQSAMQTAARAGFAGDDGYGWSDLDANGTWYDAAQGPVWQPFDASVTGFDPYGYGSWVYYSGPGYVWSSGYSWGWTPFRCGSWNYWQDFGWGWRPGSGCGSVGWGGGGHGPGRPGRGSVNLSSVPPGYHRPAPPVPGGPIRVHPIVPVRTGPGPARQGLRGSEARQIAGQTAMPLRISGSTYTPRGGSAVGSSLRRDFPVDRATGRPVMGLVTAPGTRTTRESIASPAGSVSSGVETVLGGSTAAGVTGTDQGRVNRRRAIGDQGVRPVYPSRNGAAAAAARTSGGGSTPVQPVQGRRPEPVENHSVPVLPIYRDANPGAETRPLPSERSVPIAPAPVRSAPPAPAPAPVRTAPPAPAPAPAATPSPKK